MKCIAIIGPESSGKSTLLQQVCVGLRIAPVDEYAREYLDSIGTENYDLDDLIAIAQEQFKRNSIVASETVVCDTEMMTIMIWAKEKFGFVPKELVVLFEKQYFDLYLLCRPEMKWEPDPLREHPVDRDRLFTLYEEMLIEHSLPFLIMEGSREQRLLRAVSAISS